MKFVITIDRDEDGEWIAECPSIPGCVSEESTRDEAITNVREAIALCLEVPDQVTRILLEDILKSEEEHVDYLETQIGLVEAIGLQEYLSLQVST